MKKESTLPESVQKSMDIQLLGKKRFAVIDGEVIYYYEYEGKTYFDTKENAEKVMGE